MPITPTNQVKHNVTPTGRFKLAWGGYGFARYGMSYYGQGGGVTNRNKSSAGTATITTGMPVGLLLSITYSNDITVGASWINQSKH